MTGLPIDFSFGGGFTSLGETIYKQQVSTTFSYLDTVIWTFNRHTLKFGVDVRRVQFNEANTADGTASWTSLDNLLSNTLNSFRPRPHYRIVACVRRRSLPMLRTIGSLTQT